MQKKFAFVMSAASLMLLASCSSKFGTLSSDNFTVNPNPLETQTGTVPATISATFPQKFMAKKGQVTVTPELRYTANGATQVAKGQSATFQGEKVQGNGNTVQYAVGGNYTMKTTFNYVPEMQKSELYLTFDAQIGNKKVSLPDVKVADGVVATGELYKATLTNTTASVATDAYQRVVAQKYDANIKFLIQQAELRKSELKNNSVTEFVRLLKDINANAHGFNMKNVEVSAYASPDGGFKLNDKLAAKRQDASEKYVRKQLKDIKMDTPVDAKYTAQDWEGFQELVKASNIQDKDVILRVLSMYKDPEEREAQIKNISSAFKELADGILPELRRARLTINYEVVGRSNDEILDQLNADASKLSLEELLYAATLKQNVNDKEAIYQKAAQLYPNDARAFNNIAAMEYAKGNYAEAKKYLQQALSKQGSAAEANANLGLISLLSGDTQAAQNYIAKGSSADAAKEALGNLHLAQGNYAQAVQDFEGVYSNSAALAQIMNKDYQAAKNTLQNIKNGDGTTEYLKAVVAARMGDSAAAQAAKAKAAQLDAKWAQYGTNDLELLNLLK